MDGRVTRRIALLSLAMIQLLWPQSVRAAPQQSGASTLQEQACSALESLDLPDVVVQHAQTIPSQDGTICRVRGYVRPAINFELRLPGRYRWNGSFYMAGCGGLCGGLGTNPSHIGQIDAVNAGMQRNYAVIMTDTGHWGSSSLDARWAAGNPVAFADFAYRSIGETARAGKAITEAFFGTSIRHSLFNGCSNGGRQGLVAAARFPDVFDGILAVAPAYDTRGLFSQFSWLGTANLGADRRPIFDPAKLELVRRAVLRSCGDAFGMVSDPLACSFQPSQLQCRNDETDSRSCLTAAETEVLSRWYSPARLPSGELLYPGGLAFGSEPFWGRPNDSFELFSGHRAQAAEMLRYLLTDPPLGEAFDPLSLNLERDLPLISRRAALSTPSSDLAAFRARGGKLIIVQGWADTAVPPGGSMAYYRDVERAIGPAATEATLRLFLVPGFGHCRNPAGMPGFDQNSFDALTLLEQWMSTGRAPDAMIAQRPAATGETPISRALCPYRPASGGRGLTRASAASCLSSGRR